jgi:hypothetical protein
MQFDLHQDGTLAIFEAIGDQEKHSSSHVFVENNMTSVFVKQRVQPS